jgi:putative nucleotide binding protein
MKKKDEHAIVLDYLPHGYPLEGKMHSVVQAIGEKFFSLLELAPVRGSSFTLKEKVYIGPDKRDKIYYIVGRLRKDKLTEIAKIQLQEFVSEVVGEREKEFVDFFNNSQAINTRLHQLELLPGFGKKHTTEILEARKDKPFSSFKDIKERVSSVPDPKKSVEKRITEEIMESPRHVIFVS